MGDTGKWWWPIIEAIGKGGINTGELRAAREQAVSQLRLAKDADEWEEVSRNAKNASIYDKLIELNEHVIQSQAVKMAKSMEEILDEEFDPDPSASTHAKLLRNIAKYAPPSGGGRKSRRKKRRKSKKRTKRRKSKKRKSRKHK